MKRLKKVDLKKLSIDAMTIRILSPEDERLKLAVGGGPTQGRDTWTCSREAGTC